MRYSGRIIANCPVLSQTHSIRIRKSIGSQEQSWNRSCRSLSQWYGMRSLHSTVIQTVRHNSHSTLQWLFRCYRHLEVFSLPMVYCQHWSLPLDRLWHCAHEIGIKWHGWDGSLIEWERIIQLHILLRSITKHIDHTDLVHLWNRGRHLILHVLNGQLELE